MKYVAWCISCRIHYKVITTLLTVQYRSINFRLCYMLPGDFPFYVLARHRPVTNRIKLIENFPLCVIYSKTTSRVITPIHQVTKFIQYTTVLTGREMEINSISTSARSLCLGIHCKNFCLLDFS